MIKDIKKYPELVNPQLRPRYSGVTSFFRTPVLEDAKGVDIGVIGVPFDGGVTNLTGARHGPRAVREQTTLVRRVNQATGICPFDLVSVADLGDAWLEAPYELMGAHREIQDFFANVAKAGTTTLAVGGDHSISLPILRAIAKDGPVGMVHIDAHCDTGGEFDQTRFHHGGPFRLAVLDGVLDPTRCIQIGIRGSSEYLWEFSKDAGMTVIHAEEVSALGVAEIVRLAREVVGDGPTYLSFDVDGLDPVYAPGTGTPEIGGLTTREALAVFHGLKGLNICGGDVVEVAPQYDPSTNTAQAGAQMLFEILSLMAFSPTLKP